MDKTLKDEMISIEEQMAHVNHNHQSGIQFRDPKVQIQLEKMDLQLEILDD